MRALALVVIASVVLALHTRCASRALAEVPLLERSFLEGAVGADSDLLSVRLLANDPLSHPRIRTDPGRVRLWFPNLPYTRTFEIDGEGSAVRRTFVRAGASGTGLVSIELRDATQVIPADQVSVALTASSASITLPIAASHPRAAAPIDSDDQEPVPQPSTREKPSHNAARSDVATTSLNSVPRQSGSAAAPRPSIHGARRPLGRVPSSRTATTPWTLVAVGILAALGLAAAHVLKRGRATNASRIEVLSQCRIGPKQQLIIVRAMGKDHLLSIDAQRTERLASTESHTHAKHAELAPGLIQRRDKGHSVPPASRDELLGSRAASSPEYPVELPLTTFGIGNGSFGRVLSAFRARPETHVEPISLFDDAPEPSEQGVRDSTPIDGISSLRGARSPAIAGILRLRATT